jgi:hypothetical protein
VATAPCPAAADSDDLAYPLLLLLLLLWPLDDLTLQLLHPAAKKKHGTGEINGTSLSEGDKNNNKNA